MSALNRIFGLGGRRKSTRPPAPVRRHTVAVIVLEDVTGVPVVGADVHIDDVRLTTNVDGYAATERDAVPMVRVSVDAPGYRRYEQQHYAAVANRDVVVVLERTAPRQSLSDALTLRRSPDGPIIYLSDTSEHDDISDGLAGLQRCGYWRQLVSTLLDSRDYLRDHAAWARHAQRFIDAGIDVWPYFGAEGVTPAVMGSLEDLLAASLEFCNHNHHLFPNRAQIGWESKEWAETWERLQWFSAEVANRLAALGWRGRMSIHLNTGQWGPPGREIEWWQELQRLTPHTAWSLDYQLPHEDGRSFACTPAAMRFEIEYLRAKLEPIGVEVNAAEDAFEVPEEVARELGRIALLAGAAEVHNGAYVPAPGETLPPWPASPIPLDQIHWLDEDIASWPQGSHLEEVVWRSDDHGGTVVSFRHSASPRWPVLPSDLAKGLEKTGANANLWLVARVDGRWLGGTIEWVRIEKGLTRKDEFTADNLGAYTERSAFRGWRPQSGETLYVLVSTPARLSERTINERSNLVAVQWP